MKIMNTIAPKRVELQERPLPPIGTGTALVKVEHVTLCGTDLHIWEGEYLNPFPIVQGHEFVGRIEDITPGESPWSVGERVVVSPVRSCGSCHACRASRANVCESVSVLGCYEDGALAEYVLAPIDALRPVPADLTVELAPLSEPASIALQAVHRGRPQAGELAVVIGCGPIGLIATLALQELGVNVVAVDSIPSRAAAAAEFGARGNIAIDPARGFPTTQEIVDAANAEPAQPITLVIEATGAPAAFAAAVDIAAPTARIVAVGISDRDTTIPMRTIPLKELDILGSRNSLDLIGDALSLIVRNQSQFASLITHRFSFEQTEQALNIMRTEAADVRKILISL